MVANGSKVDVCFLATAYVIKKCSFNTHGTWHQAATIMALPNAYINDCNNGKQSTRRKLKSWIGIVRNKHAKYSGVATSETSETQDVAMESDEAHRIIST
jgi:hypothetical protein